MDQRRRLRVVTVLGCLGLAWLGLAPTSAQADQGGNERVTICHATASAKNPYVVQTVSASALGGGGRSDHSAHAGDIIPPVNGHDGLNWGPEGMATYAAGCAPVKSANAQKIPDADTDEDGIPDALDPDDDEDGIRDEVDPDADGDGIPDSTDPSAPHPRDSDGDGIDDGRDVDDDNDCIVDALDADRDGDGLADAVESDADNDGTPDATDVDDDGDGVPDVLDSDDDGDGRPDAVDAPANTRASAALKPAVDPVVPLCSAPGQLVSPDDAIDTDGDGSTNDSDADDDGDSVPDASDRDQDGDGVDNAVDPDDDGDGIPDLADPDTAIDDQPRQTDTDGDGTPDATDDDVDGDGIPNRRDGDADGDGTPEVRATQLVAGTQVASEVRDRVANLLLTGSALTAEGRPITLQVRCLKVTSTATPSLRTGRSMRLAPAVVPFASTDQAPAGDVPPVDVTNRSCNLRNRANAVLLDLAVDGTTAVIVTLTAPPTGDAKAFRLRLQYLVRR